MSELFYYFYFIYLIRQYIVDVDMVQGRGGGMSSIVEVPVPGREAGTAPTPTHHAHPQNTPTLPPPPAHLQELSPSSI